MVSFSVEGVLTKIVVLDMYKALSIQKIRQKYKNADITQDTLLSMCNGFTGMGIFMENTLLLLELQIFSLLCYRICIHHRQPNTRSDLGCYRICMLPGYFDCASTYSSTFALRSKAITIERYCACKALGWKKITCHIIELDDKQAFEVSTTAFKTYVSD
jgi:hypothetical protein